MARDSGRTDKPGNKKGTPGGSHIAMKHPNMHIQLQKSKK